MYGILLGSINAVSGEGGHSKWVKQKEQDKEGGKTTTKIKHRLRVGQDKGESTVQDQFGAQRPSKPG